MAEWYTRAWRRGACRPSGECAPDSGWVSAGFARPTLRAKLCEDIRAVVANWTEYLNELRENASARPI